MALLENSQNAHIDFIDCVTKQAKEAYRLSRSGLLNDIDRSKFSLRAKKLRNAAEVLFDTEFHESTQDFEELTKQLRNVNESVQAEIDRLNDAVNKIQDIATLLKLFDQAIAIASSVAPK